MFVKAIFLLVTALMVIGTIDSAKILGLFSTPSKSHLIVHNALMNGLAEKGHEVTVVTTLPQPKSKHSNYRNIYIETNDGNTIEKLFSEMIKGAEGATNIYGHIPKFITALSKRSIYTITHPKFQELKNETFDLLILGWVLNDFQLGVAGHFQCPTVVVSTIKSFRCLRDYVGSPTGVSTIVHEALERTDNMSFFQRLKNFIINIIDYVCRKALNYFVYEVHYRELFPPDQYPSLEEVKKNISLVLLNHHFSQGGVEAYVPAMIEVGGMHINTKTSPLPDDIQKWLDSATDGAIFFSLGSNVKSSMLTADKREAILRVFSKLKQKILWKWEDDQLPGKPDNVMIGKWFPQNDILAHPNLKLFISHCGVSSINEARHHGVPVLGVPIFADQPANLNAIFKEGWAVPLNYGDLNEKSLTKALNEVLNNPIYSVTIKNISNLYKDRPNTALETAVFWVEYVIRHKGAKHMQSQSVHLNIFQYHSLDVIGFIFIVIYVIIKMFKIIFKLMFNKCKSKLKNKRE